MILLVHPQYARDLDPQASGVLPIAEEVLPEIAPNTEEEWARVMHKSYSLDMCLGIWLALLCDLEWGIVYFMGNLH